ncbi:hypothetical protein CDN99_14465 [Roseateles aquatilis]|uniref:Uncharacterized protein n=1 Tax=Roseateles aquatilis TaxID=431061 RepID=A0A246J812_9BURK|nr:hypothetical protein CDN99_14465 [Roseateles aquatilis]
MHGLRNHARAGPHRSPSRDHPELHGFSDSALHTVLLAAVIIVAVTAVVQMVKVGTLMWQLDPVVVEGKAQSVPLPAAPQPLVPAEPQTRAQARTR